MAFLLKSITFLTIVALSSAQYKLNKAPKKYQAEKYQQPTQQPILQLPQYDSYSAIPTQGPVIPVNFQLPRIDRPSVPFFTPQPSAVLSAPRRYSTQPANNFFEYPVPSQELQVPAQVAWNPKNDPKYLYNVVPVAKLEQPTNVYPKKYNKDLHEEAKPFSNKLKANLNNWNGQDRSQIKNLNKQLQNLAKQENQRRIVAEKVQKPKKSATTKRHKYEPTPAASGYSSGYDSDGLSHAAVLDSGEYDDYSHSDYTHGDYAHGNFAHAAYSGGDYSGADYSEGLSDDLKSNLGLPYTSPKERLEFHMHGHDGPDSYKWGYDVGKGHDRQFRYEERDHLGYVKGHYGFYDDAGKLQMVNYDSNPIDGFHAEGNFGKF